MRCRGCAWVRAAAAVTHDAFRRHLAGQSGAQPSLHLELSRLSLPVSHHDHFDSSLKAPRLQR
jgi:hypothetical protein